MDKLWGSMCTHMQRPAVEVGVLLCCTPHCFLSPSLSLNLEFNDSATAGRHQVPGLSTLPPQCWHYRPALSMPLMWVLRSSISPHACPSSILLSRPSSQAHRNLRKYPTQPQHTWLVCLVINWFHLRICFGSRAKKVKAYSHSTVRSKHLSVNSSKYIWNPKVCEEGTPNAPVTLPKTIQDHGA